MSRGQKTLLLDADPLGGGLDLVVGCEEVPGLRKVVGQFLVALIRAGGPGRGSR